MIIIAGREDNYFIETNTWYIPTGYWFFLMPYVVSVISSISAITGALAFLCVAAASSLLTHLWLTYAMTWAHAVSD